MSKAKGKRSMRSFWVVGIASILLAGLAGCQSWQIPDDELAMYGGRGRTPEQHAADTRFVQQMVQQFGTLQKGSNVCAERGWRAFYQGQLQDAMRRFNQSWLLDRRNAQAYWGFGAVAIRQGNYRQGLDLLIRAYNLEPQNPRIVSEMAYAYALNGRNGRSEDDTMYLRLAEEYFKKASYLDPAYPLLYSQWAEARYYQRDWQGAWERVMKARALGGGGTIHPELIEKLSEHMPDPYVQ